jgi:hypothetical protein
VGGGNCVEGNPRGKKSENQQTAKLEKGGGEGEGGGGGDLGGVLASKSGASGCPLELTRLKDKLCS